jgi:hypothetical protein
MPEERRSHLQRGGSLKSRTFCENFLYRFYANWNKNIETTGNILSTVTAFTTSVFTKTTNAQRHYVDLYILNVTQVGEEIRTLRTDICLCFWVWITPFAPIFTSCSRIFCTELLYRVSRKSDKGFSTEAHGLQIRSCLFLIRDNREYVKFLPQKEESSSPLERKMLTGK